jgi:carboxypeptidase PM20D1
MIKKLFKVLGLLALVFLSVVLFNTFTVKPVAVSKSEIKILPLPDAAVLHMSSAIQFPTISISDSSAIDTAAFRFFGYFLEKAYPLVHKQLIKTMINDFSFVFEWKGKDSTLKPIILMGHYDVVPVEPATLNKWTEGPFSGKITDSCIWGRGAADDKSGVISILEATEAMLQKGFVPNRNIYLCFGHNEEVSGAGAFATASWLAEKKVHAEMVLDEGGEITENKIPEITRPVAVIGVAEKGYASFELKVDKPGGHSSMPENETAIDILAKALYQLRNKPIPGTLTPPVKEFLLRIGSSSDNFFNRMAISNMWAFEGITKKILASKPEGMAMIHTTIVPTIIKSGIKDNVIPGTAMAVVNSRILPGETALTVENFIRDAIADPRVSIKKLGKYDSDPSPATPFTAPAYKRIESAVYKTIPNILPTPYLMIGATDSRHYRKIADGVVNFFPNTDSKGYHAVNERVAIRDFQRDIQFIITIIEESNRSF